MIPSLGMLIRSFIKGNLIFLFWAGLFTCVFSTDVYGQRGSSWAWYDSITKVLHSEEYLAPSIMYAARPSLDRRFFNQPTQLPRELRKAGFVLLGNVNGLVPIQQLEKQQITLLSIGVHGPNIFEETLNLYHPTQTVSLPLTADRIAIEAAKAQIPEGSLLIVGLHQAGAKPSYNNPYGELLTGLVDSLSVRPNTILSLFLDPLTLMHFKEIHQADAVLIAHQDDYTQQQLAGQVIFGGLGVGGRLPVSADPRFREGIGVKTAGGQRLTYDVPDAADMDELYLTNELTAVIQEGLDSAAFPGCQVLVARKGKVVFHKAFGHHTYEKKRAVQLNDLYDLASVTKVTAPLPALMQLHDQGKFDLDAPFSLYWPDFKKKDKKYMTVREVLSHRAGLKPYINFYQNEKKKDGSFKPSVIRSDSSAKYSIALRPGMYLSSRYAKKMYKQVKKSPVDPTMTYQYAGLSFLLYPAIIENLSGKSYENYLRTHVYDRLGAARLTFTPLRRFPREQIVPTEVDTFFRSMLLQGVVHDEASAMLGGLSGNAGLFGNANDLAKLLQMYLWGGTYGGERFISDTTLQAFTSRHFADDDNRRGLGFDKPMLENKADGYVAEAASEASYGHSGYTGTFFWIDPAEELIFIFLSNRVHPTRDNKKLYQLNLRPRMHQVLYDAIFE